MIYLQRVALCAFSGNSSSSLRFVSFGREVDFRGVKKASLLVFD